MAQFDGLIWPTPGIEAFCWWQEALMERKAKVELFEQIRREYEFGLRGEWLSSFSFALITAIGIAMGNEDMGMVASRRSRTA
jgi:hypothetical protein